MFRKIISNLSFSPALVGQLSFYAKRLRKEETTRRLGLVFTALALIVQSLVLLQPPESANAASSNDFIRGGISNISELLAAYDKNSNNLKDIYTYFGITRDEISKVQRTSWPAGDTRSWGFESRFSYAKGERKVDITDSDGDYVKSIYGRPMKLYSSYSNKNVEGWVGYSDSIGWFGIVKSCANLATKKLPPPPPPEESKIVLSKSALNISKSSVDATSVVASESDLIRYTLTIENKGLAPTSVDITENLADVLEYATISDNGGGTLNSSSKTLSWPTTDIAQGGKQVRVFAVRLLSNIPATAQGQSEPTSFNCVMTNVFGNQVDVSVNCPTEKVIERVVEELPKTGPTENMIFGGSLLAVVTYFYIRAKQLKTEVRLVRRNVNTGAI